MDNVEVIEKVVTEEPELPVHVPYANYSSPGIASFNSTDFHVEQDGEVQLSKEIKAIREDAEEAAAAAESSAEEATVQASLAATYMQSAQTAASDANNSALSASGFAAQSSAYAEQAKQSAQDAADSATEAEGYKDTATQQAQAATSSASAAAQSASNAVVSANTATDAKTAAQAAEQNAEQSATNAETFADNAETSASQAADSALLAQQYRDQAKDYAKKEYQIYNSFDSLPRPGDSAFIYLVPASESQTNDKYNEYLWIDNINDYEYLGAVNDIDLSNYAQQNGTYPNMTVGKATADANGNNIVNTYATKAENNAKYTKPSGGIPESDLAQAVKDKLNEDVGIQNYEVIVRQTLPTADANSPDFVQTADGKIYRKESYIDDNITVSTGGHCDLITTDNPIVTSIGNRMFLSVKETEYDIYELFEDGSYNKIYSYAQLSDEDSESLIIIGYDDDTLILTKHVVSSSNVVGFRIKLLSLSTNTITDTREMSGYRFSTTSGRYMAYGDGMLYFNGAKVDSDGDRSAVGIYKYDFANRSITALYTNGTTGARLQSGNILYYDRKIYCVRGDYGNINYPNSLFGYFDVDAGGWTTLQTLARTSLPNSQQYYSGHAVVQVGGKIYGCGGRFRISAPSSGIEKWEPDYSNTDIANLTAAAANMRTIQRENDVVFVGGVGDTTPALYNLNILSAGNLLYRYIQIPNQSDVDVKYTKPSTGIPESDLASAVQTSLGKADTAYQKPSTGIPKTDLASAVQTSLGKADTALQSVPLATASAVGGVKPVSKTDDMTQSVGVDENGALYTAVVDIAKNSIIERAIALPETVNNDTADIYAIGNSEDTEFYFKNSPNTELSVEPSLFHHDAISNSDTGGTTTFVASGGNGEYAWSTSYESGFATLTPNGNTATLSWYDSVTSTHEGTVTCVSGDKTVVVSCTIETTFCLTGDTLITMYNGKKKRIDEVQEGEYVMSFNPESGLLEKTRIYFSDAGKNKTNDHYDKYTFEDGTVLKVVHRHRLYNVDLGRMVHLDTWNIGERAFKQNGKTVKLVKKEENIEETINHYTIFCKNQNYFANGLLAGNRFTKKLNIKGE